MGKPKKIIEQALRVLYCGQPLMVALIFILKEILWNTQAKILNLEII